nr:TPA_asm: m32.5 sORF 1 [Murid betaherpesvirus 1]DBA07760.1 TPA_asm: m32.5 sORF 1 [Murid betaherpesvirus 1]
MRSRHMWESVCQDLLMA